MLCSRFHAVASFLFKEEKKTPIAAQRSLESISIFFVCRIDTYANNVRRMKRQQREKKNITDEIKKNSKKYTDYSKGI